MLAACSDSTSTAANSKPITRAKPSLVPNAPNIKDAEKHPLKPADPIQNAATNVAPRNPKIPAIWQNRHPWGSYPIGSQVTSERQMGAQKVKAVKTLKGIQEGTISLEIQSDLGMGVPRVNSLKIPVALSFPVHGGIPMGTQTLKIDGKEVSCEKFVIIGDESTKDETKPFVKERGVCVNDAIKVPLVLWEFAEYNTIPYNTKVTAVSLDDEIVLGKQKVKAVRLEGEIKKGAEIAGLTRWLAPEVPGWLVRENRVDAKGVVTERVLSFTLGQNNKGTP